MDRATDQTDKKVRRQPCEGVTTRAVRSYSLGGICTALAMFTRVEMRCSIR